jgi:pyridoxamine 5'-phosphate oxidase
MTTKALSGSPTTNSRKGRELAGNPFAALQFHWVELERVVRIEGRVEKSQRRRKRRLLPLSRPLDSRIGAWASPQSQRHSLTQSG